MNNELSELSFLRAELRRAQEREKELFEENMKLRAAVGQPKTARGVMLLQNMAEDRLALLSDTLQNIDHRLKVMAEAIHLLSLRDKQKGE